MLGNTPVAIFYSFVCDPYEVLTDVSVDFLKRI